MSRLYLVICIINLCLIGMEHNAYAQVQDETPALGNTSRRKVDVIYVDACTEMMRGDYQSATELYKEVLMTDPSHHASMYNIARLAVLQRQYDIAIDYGLSALDLEKTNYWYHNILQQAYEFKGDYKKSIDIQEEVVKRFPDQFQDKLKLVDLYARNNQADKATEILKQLQKSIGSNDLIATRLYDLYIQQKQFPQAIRVSGDLIGRDSSNANYWAMLYKAYEVQGDVTKGIESLKSALEYNTDNEFILTTLLNYKSSDISAAESFSYLSMLVNSLEIPLPVKVNTLQKWIDDPQLGKTYESQLQGLIGVLQTLHIGEPEVDMMKAELQMQDGNLRQAKQLYRQSLAEDPSQPDTWLKLLSASFQLGDLDELKVDAEEALEFYPNDDEFLFYYGYASSVAGDEDAALYAFEKIKRRNTGNLDIKVKALVGLSELYTRQDQINKARENFEILAALAPEDTTYLNAYAVFLAEQELDTDKAESIAKKLTQSYPGVAKYESTYAWVLYYKNKLDEAIRLLRGSVEKEPSAISLERLGDALYKNGQTDEATSFWKQAINKGATIDIEKKLNR